MHEFPQNRDKIMELAVSHVGESFDLLKHQLDENFEKDFVKKHPEVLVAAIHAAAIAYAGSIIAAAIQDAKVK